jgi:hypothetical protein
MNNMLTVFIVLFLYFTTAHSWEGLVINGIEGKTQLFTQGTLPVITYNVPFDLPNLKYTAAVTLNGLIYYIGGTDETRNISRDENGRWLADFGAIGHDSVMIFDPKTNLTTEGQRMNFARSTPVASVVNGTIIVCGGNTTNEILPPPTTTTGHPIIATTQDPNANVQKLTSTSTCEQYIPSEQKWNIIASLCVHDSYKSNNHRFAMVTLHNDVYAFGGSSGSNIQYGSQSYDLSKNVYKFGGNCWIERKPMPFAKSDHASIAIDNDRALVCGGSGNTNCYIYSASLNQWSSAPKMAQTRRAHQMVIFKGKQLECFLNEFHLFCLEQIYILSGNTIELYSLQTGGTIVHTDMVYETYFTAVAIDKTLLPRSIYSL